MTFALSASVFCSAHLDNRVCVRVCVLCVCVCVCVCVCICKLLSYSVGPYINLLSYTSQEDWWWHSYQSWVAANWYRCITSASCCSPPLLAEPLPLSLPLPPPAAPGEIGLINHDIWYSSVQSCVVLLAFATPSFSQFDLKFQFLLHRSTHNYITGDIMLCI